MKRLISSLLRDLDEDVLDASLIDNVLHAIRTHLGMPTAYLTEFIDGEACFRNVDTELVDHPVVKGGSRALQDSYCQLVLDGALPQVIPDTARNPVAAALPITAEAQIGSHMSIPILLEDGTPYGMFCCLSPTPNPTLNDRDLHVLGMFADLVAQEVRIERKKSQKSDASRERIRQVLANEQYAIAFQPIVNLWNTQPVGFEALCRFQTEEYRTPDVWFDEAASVGLGTELEVNAIRMAMRGLSHLGPDQYISVNASPQTVLSDAFQDEMRNVDLRRLVLEITEHAVVADYDAFIEAIRPLRARGLRLAIDDAGAGHSSLRHILQLSPDYLKLDMSLTRNVHEDLSRRALVSALVFYSRETSAQIIAEGIETADERDMLKLLGVLRGQGYFLGRPDFNALPGSNHVAASSNG